VFILPIILNGRIKSIGNSGECKRGPFPKTWTSNLETQSIIFRRYDILDSSLTKEKRATIARQYQKEADSFSDHNHVRNARNAYSPLLESLKWSISAGDFKQAELTLAQLTNVIKTTTHCPPPNYIKGEVSILRTMLETAKENAKLKNGQPQAHYSQTEQVIQKILTT
jgi:hypothetical protein